MAAILLAALQLSLGGQIDADSQPREISVESEAPLVTHGPNCVKSANFIVRSTGNKIRLDQFAPQCESARDELYQRWLNQESPASWRPHCEVVLHATQSSYLKAVGSGGAQTVGSSLIRTQGGAIVQRRIDLLADKPGRAVSTLRHELTHVLLATLFPEKLPPMWAEEGLALLSDSPDKRARHQRDLEIARQSGRTLPIVSLISTSGYPPGVDRATFYAQSMSLVDYLTSHESPEQFLQFVDMAQDVGEARALQAVYNISDLSELDRRWKRCCTGCKCGCRRRTPANGVAHQEPYDSAQDRH